jgi:hypothetical protein
LARKFEFKYKKNNYILQAKHNKTDEIITKMRNDRINYAGEYILYTLNGNTIYIVEKNMICNIFITYMEINDNKMNINYSYLIENDNTLIIGRHYGNIDMDKLLNNKNIINIINA